MVHIIMHMLTQQIIDADPDEGDPETACIQTCSIQTRQSTFTPVSLIKPSFGLRIIIFWSVIIWDSENNAYYKSMI